MLYQNVPISGLHVISYNGTRYIALGMDAVSTMRFRVWGQWSALEPFLIDSAASGLSYVSAVATTPHINTNASSATKLQTARTLYVTSYNNYRAGDGVAFDGTGDVTLKLPNSITASDWFRSYGATGWYNESYGGGIYMEDATWVRVFNNKSFYCASNILAGGDVTAYSDARLKSDIRPLTNRGFIEPKTYIKGGKRSIGFLAQDVMAIYPELVTDTGGADHWLALNYGNLVAVLEAQIIDHEERIKRLEDRT